MAQGFDTERTLLYASANMPSLAFAANDDNLRNQQQAASSNSGFIQNDNDSGHNRDQWWDDFNQEDLEEDNDGIDKEDVNTELQTGPARSEPVAAAV